MEEVVIKARPRTVVGKQVKAMRRNGELPAVLYGHDMDPMPITLNMHDASRTLSSIPLSHLVVIDLDGERHTTLVREKQRHPVWADLLHVDFQAISLTEKIRTEVSIRLVGESLAVKDMNGVLVQNLEEVEIEAYPKDLPDWIEIDISSILKIGDTLHVRDIHLPAEIEVLADPNEIVVVVTGQAAEEVEEVVEVVAAEPEVIERGKKEEEEF